jgi:hypothetical protein
MKEKFSYLTDHSKSKLLFASVKPNPRIKYTLKVKGKALSGEISLGDFMDVKGWKAVGNRLSDQILTGIKEVEATQATAGKEEPEAADLLQGNLFGEPEPLIAEPRHEQKATGANAAPKEAPAPDKFKAGDVIEFE